MSRTIDALAARPWLVWSFLLFMTGPAVWGLFRLEFSDEPRLLLGEDDPQGRRLRELHEAFGLDVPRAVVVVQADDLFSPQAIAALRDLVDEVDAMEEVQRVESILNVPTFERPDWLANRPLLGWLASLVPRPLIPPDGTDPQALNEAREAALAHPLVAGRLLSSDSRTTIAVAHLDVPEAGEMPQGIIQRLQDVADLYASQTPLRVRVTGVAPIRMEIIENLRTELPRFLLLAVVVALIVAILLFGQWLPALIAGGAALLGVLWTLGGLGLAGQPLGVVNNVLPTLVLVIGFTDAVHLMFEFRRARGRGDSPPAAAVHSVKRVGRACALTSLTTAIGFGSLTLAQTEVIREFGLAAAAGTVLTFLAVVTFTPLVCRTWVGRRIRPRRRSQGSTRWGQQRFARLGERVVRRRRSISAAGCLLTMALGTTAWQLTPSNQLTDALPADTEASRALEHLDRELGGILQAQVLVEWTDELGPLPPQVLSAMRSVHESVIDGGATPLSLVSVVDALPAVYRFLLPFVAAVDFDAWVAVEQRAEQFLQMERRQALVHIRLPDWGTAANSEFFSDLRERLRTVEREHVGIRLALTGETVLASQRMGRVMRELGKSVGVATVLIALVMSCGFRSLRLGVISMLPNLLTLAVVAAVIYWLGGVVTLTALMVFSVCLGIATDDTIHFLNGLDRESRASDRAAAVIATLERVGPAMATSTLVLLSGFGAASLSSIPTTQEFAYLAAIAVATALAVDLVVLSALVAWLSPRRT